MKIKYIIECDGGYATLDNTQGIGNPVLPTVVGQSGASQTDPNCIGSGDIFGNPAPSKKKRDDIPTNENNLNPFDKIGQGMAKILGIKPVFVADKENDDNSIRSTL